MYGVLTESDLEQLRTAMGGREQRMRFLVQQAATLPTFSAVERDMAQEVFGCEARVWLLLNLRPDDTAEDSIEVRFDSESRVVKGLLALIQQAVDGASAQQVADYDLDAHLAALGLTDFVSSSRRNGLRAAVTLLKESAARPG
ncbi:SufE family protein [Pseudidiomarina salinarum]|uniref:SufE family protein n=1 Tax=Pseudidiomarina salinarum TaxID=435908 RepID=UPI000AE19872|nr:SufE family protein [Pseudidiomarina salinarum]